MIFEREQYMAIWHETPEPIWALDLGHQLYITTHRSGLHDITLDLKPVRANYYNACS